MVAARVTKAYDSLFDFILEKANPQKSWHSKPRTKNRLVGMN